MFTNYPFSKLSGSLSLCQVVAYRRLRTQDFILTSEFVHLTLQDVMIGIIYANYLLLKYLILVAKSYIWNCRRNLSPPVINAFKLKAKIKCETGKNTCICVNTNNMDKFNKKWDLSMGSVPNP